MRVRAATWLIWPLWLVTLLLVAASLVLDVANGALVTDTWGAALLGVSFVTMGALVAAAPAPQQGSVVVAPHGRP